MKIKVKPEDFIVKELADIKYSSDGPYRIYLLEKRHWNTMDALKFISRENKVPLSKIGSGGRKDRHALTSQYISVPKKYELKFERPNVKLTFLGFADDFVSPAILEGNYFEITLRKLKPEEEEKIKERLPEVERFGYPNFFDDQRFGSVENPQEFLAERIIKKHYSGALKLYFTVIHPEDSKKEKERKMEIDRLWGNWEAILPLCRTSVEKEIVKILIENSGKKGLLAALNAIPKEELSMFFSAYQSFLWNLTLKKLLPNYVSEFFEVKGKIMDYYFYRTIPDGSLKCLRKMEIPTVSSRIPECLPEVKKAIDEVLAERGVKPSDFNLKKIRKSFFKSFMRPAIVFPEGLYVGPFEEDDLYPGYKKVTLKFTLPPGSFATMMVKSLGV
ncbi:tRNA pseudouridine synthase D [Fervidicola ferrireducens]|uniref:tRNA pseudouridine synthase D n=1 Tax=Fervidicola ferrireducens TaxID=520764 RepID=A0A140LCT9_9FIRM|nr:tRNA pseudouridine(13) synthase TruD [Fervidicola ferrireducens]KXG78364.1 tRNA pseudouridine synthase D [Fervidicola ferrireducens]